jgi:hypothetical protein
LLSSIDNNRGISEELQTGKAAEHLVCADLIIQGFNAFLSDAGLPYDIVVDLGAELIRIQVKAASRPATAPSVLQRRKFPVYRYLLRRAKKGARGLKLRECDFFAFVAMDIKEIAYVKSSDLISKKNNADGQSLIQGIEFRSSSLPTSHLRLSPTTRCFDDFKDFKYT